MRQEQGGFHFSRLPTEIHHVIFSYLDYVRDICCDQLLFVPDFNMPLTCKEFEEGGFGETEKFIDFDHPNIVPFFLACKSLLKSVKSFRPSQLNITTFFYERSFCRYNIDYRYRELLPHYPWFKTDPKVSCYISHREWVEIVVKLIEKMKRFCKTNPFKNVEFISISEFVGRNYSSSPPYFLVSDFEKVVNLIPSVKYLSCELKSFRAFSITERSIVILNAFTTEGHPRSGLFQQNNYYSPAVGVQEFDNIEKLKEVFPKNYPTRIEVFLFNSLTSYNFQESKNIIDNFSLNINLFSYIWNVKSCINEIMLDQLPSIMEILNIIYKKYPSFRVFRIPIDSVDSLKLILTYPFVDINVGKNITKKFLESIDLNDVPTLSKDYNIDFSKLGNYKFSAACFREASKLQLDRNTCDIFGVTPDMISPGENVSNLNVRDKFGNNFLHYFYSIPKKLDVLNNFTKEELDKLGNEENIFGVCPKEIVIFSGYRDKEIGDFIHKKFSYEGIYQSVISIYYPKLILLDGLMVDARILYAAKGVISPDRFDYTDYEDANYRDLNGKHLYHYSYSRELVENQFEMSPKDTLFGKDNNQTIPIQLQQVSYQNLMDQLARINYVPKINFISYSDNFGMYRFQYLMTGPYLNTFLMISEADSIGFDYSSGQPELVSLFSNYEGGLYYFSIEKSPLQKLRNINLYGTVDGDDFSHYTVRFYLDYIKRNPRGTVENSILKALIARGLKFDATRNSKGETAFDLLDEITKLPNTPRLSKEFNDLKKVCKRGLGNQSRALPKFSIRYTNIPENVIVEKTETKLIISSVDVSGYRIRIKRTLYFEKKDYVKQTK